MKLSLWLLTFVIKYLKHVVSICTTCLTLCILPTQCIYIVFDYQNESDHFPKGRHPVRRSIENAVLSVMQELSFGLQTVHRFGLFTVILCLACRCLGQGSMATGRHGSWALIGGGSGGRGTGSVSPSSSGDQNVCVATRFSKNSVFMIHILI
jgi:hypothetical protein